MTVEVINIDYLIVVKYSARRSDIHVDTWHKQSTQTPLQIKPTPYGTPLMTLVPLLTKPLNSPDPNLICIVLLGGTATIADCCYHEGVTYMREYFHMHVRTQGFQLEHCSEVRCSFTSTRSGCNVGADRYLYVACRIEVHAGCQLENTTWTDQATAVKGLVLHCSVSEIFATLINKQQMDHSVWRVWIWIMKKCSSLLVAGTYTVC